MDNSISITSHNNNNNTVHNNNNNLYKNLNFLYSIHQSNISSNKDNSYLNNDNCISLSNHRHFLDLKPLDYDNNYNYIPGCSMISRRLHQLPSVPFHEPAIRSPRTIPFFFPFVKINIEIRHIC